MRTLRASGLLAQFDEAGVLTPADVHVATCLGRLGGESDERVLLAVALVVRGTRHGSVVLDLADAATTTTPDGDDADVVDAAALPWPAVAEWIDACARSPLVLDTPAGPPVRILGSRLWLARYWRQEAEVAHELLRRSADRPCDVDLAALRADLDELFATPYPAEHPDPADDPGPGDEPGPGAKPEHGADPAANRARGADPRPGDGAPSAPGVGVDDGETGEADQRLATSVAVLSRVSVIAGGPGTGKTTTIARLITVLRRQFPDARIALAAPTGKAAARLEQAVHSAAGALAGTDRAALLSMSASTLHRLLGRRPGLRSRFRHDRENRLPFDVVVVDECSMVSLTLMARLLEALAPATRLILVGDPDQLASVEAGAVLGDLVYTERGAEQPGADQDSTQRDVERPDADPHSTGRKGADRTGTDRTGPDRTGGDPAGSSLAADLRRLGNAVPEPVRPHAPDTRLRESVAVLRTVHRFQAGGAIARLAEHIRAGRADEVLSMLLGGLDGGLEGGLEGIDFYEAPDDEPISGAALQALQAQAVHEVAAIEAARSGDVAAALDALDRHRLLCAHRSGPRGERHWSQAVERWLAAADPALTPRLDGRYAGQPLLVTANDYENGLYNGDTGVVVQVGDDLAAAFHRGGAPVILALVRLSDVRALHAMTVHRAQGSQFDEVTVLLPLAGSPLATRQTLYTAITRASSRVRLVGSQEAVSACVHRQAARATGLRDRLAGSLAD